MAISDPLLLPDDVSLVPVEELSADLREQMECEEGDYVITRPRLRAPSRIIDNHTAELLKFFQKPTTIVQAIIHFSRRHKLNPEQVLTDAFPLLQNFLDASFLVAADVEQQILPSLAVNARVAGYTVLSCVHVVEDTEVYRGRAGNGESVALKLSRSGCDDVALRRFQQEISILQRLDGKVNPALLDAGMLEDRSFLVTTWCSGVDISVAMETLQQQSKNDNRNHLLRLCTGILDAYSHLHAQGILHGDIHPGNIVVSSDGSIKIIDYGFARSAHDTFVDDGRQQDGRHELQRTDISYLSEPEYAQSILAGLKPPAPNMQGEQFSLAALLYFLLTGAQYLKFSLEREEVLQHIVAGHPLPFSAWGIQPWFEVETLLATALSKNPAHRFSSVAEFSRKLNEVLALDEQPPTAHAQGSTVANTELTEELLERTLQHLGPEGSRFTTGFTHAPACSLSNGAAGIAYTLYRIACIQDRAALLSLADIWSMKALHTLNSAVAFYNDTNATPAIIGRVSPYHTASGVYCVQAFISHALGDLASLQEAIGFFIASSQLPCANIDLTLGRAGTLLASSFLLDKVLQHKTLHAEHLLAFGNGIMQGMWDEIKALPPIQECFAIQSLGIAHGWAGLLYATLCWCQSSGTAYPDTIKERLQQLAACAESYGRGVRWPRTFPHQKLTGTYMSGWCNGSAGYIHLWTLAQRFYGDELYGRLAEQAAWNVWETGSSTAILCCGLAGKAYGLLNLYKHSGERVWLTRAHTLAQQAVLKVQDSIPHTIALHNHLEPHAESLYYGSPGVALLAADMTRPEEAYMPFFERE